MKDLKNWAREIERAVEAAEREVCAQNAAFKDEISDWGTSDMVAQFATVATASPGAERKRHAFPSGGFLRG